MELPSDLNEDNFCGLNEASFFIEYCSPSYQD